MEKSEGRLPVVASRRTELIEDLSLGRSGRVAVAPVEAPQIVVAVIAEHGRGGGATAAPIAQKVLQAYFVERGVVPPPAPAEPAPQAQVAATPENGNGAD